MSSDVEDEINCCQGVFMRYIGGKSKLLNDIHQLVNDKVNDGSKTFIDLFAGTGCVGASFKQNFQVFANDYLYFAYLLSAGTLQHNTAPAFSGLASLGIQEPLDYLNALVPNVDNKGNFVTHSYSPYGSDQRKYFTSENAAMIDAVRQQIRDWSNGGQITQSEKEYLLCALIEAVSLVSNTTGTYGAFLKNWDARALKSLELKHPILEDNGKDNGVFNKDAGELVKQISFDVCYMDPPYNNRQYSSNYHVLETIARYDNPEIKGVTGMRQDSTSMVSSFSRKREAYEALDRVVKDLRAKHLILSYSSDGILTQAEIEGILKKHCDSASFEFRPIVYSTYKSKIAGRPTVNEFLFYARKAV